MAREGTAELNVPVDTQRLLEHLSKVEAIAEDILTDKQKLVNLDRHRNQTREAMRIIQKDKSKSKHWVCLNNMFIKMDKSSVTKLLDKDFDETALEISKTQKELKPKVDHLRGMEKKDPLQGFNLEPLSQSELAALDAIL